MRAKSKSKGNFHGVSAKWRSVVLPVQPVSCLCIYLLKLERYANRKHPAGRRMPRGNGRLTRLKLHHKASALFTRRRTDATCDTIVSACSLYQHTVIYLTLPYLFRLRSPWLYNQQFLLRVGRHVRLAERSQADYSERCIHIYMIL